MKRTKKYWNDIAAYLTGEMNNEQIEKFLLQIKDKQQLKNDYELMKNTWKNFKTNPSEKYADTTSAWGKLNERIENDGMLDTFKPVIKLQSVNYFMRVAAVILVILAVGIPSVYYSVNNLGNSKNIIEKSSENGVTTVDLPDGSRVFLNEGSSIEYYKNYEEKREVKMKGEGFFDVMSDPQKPFRVNTGKVVVTVLGTSFNIKETRKQTVEVFVKSGKVRLDLKKEKESIVLNPGELGEVNGHIKKSELSNANYLSWKTKEFKFVDESIDNILEELQAAYHVEVNSNIQDIGERRLTTTYSEMSFEAILTTICTALELNFEKEGKVYILHTN